MALGSEICDWIVGPETGNPEASPAFPLSFQEVFWGSTLKYATINSF
jgi:hypothetical protein